MDTNTTRRNLLRIGTTAAAYAAGASIVTGGIAIASQAKGAAIGVSAGMSKALRAVESAERAYSDFDKAATYGPNHNEEAAHFGDRAAEAEKAVCNYPSEHLADVAAKLAFFIDRDLGESIGNVELVLADVRRLATQGAR